MITHCSSLDRKIKESRIEEIYERLRIPKIDQNFAEVLAEFGQELRENPIFAPYIKNVGIKREEYLKRPDIVSILQNATYSPVGQQVLDQDMLTREERKSEYFSLWVILRFSELYDISSHGQIRAELKAKNDLRGLADFEEGIVVVSTILEGNSNFNLADFYLSHAQRLIAGVARFLNEQLSTSNQNQSISCIHPVKTEILSDEQEPINEKNLSNSKTSSVKRKRESCYWNIGFCVYKKFVARIKIFRRRFTSNIGSVYRSIPLTVHQDQQVCI